MQAPASSNSPAPAVQSRVGSTSGRRRRDPLLVGLTVIAVTVLLADLWLLRPGDVGVTPSWSQRFTQPLELNPVRHLPLLPRADLHAFAWNGNTLFAVGESGTLLRSKDAGESWERIAVGTGDELRNVGFYDIGFDSDHVGLIVGRDGAVLLNQEKDETRWTLFRATPPADSPSYANQAVQAVNAPVYLPPRAMDLRSGTRSPETGLVYLAGAMGTLTFDPSGNYSTAFVSQTPAYVLIASKPMIVGGPTGLEWAGSNESAQTKQARPTGPNKIPGSFTTLAVAGNELFAAGDRFLWLTRPGSTPTVRARTDDSATLTIHESVMTSETAWAVGEKGAVWRINKPQTTLLLDVERRNVPRFAGNLYAITYLPATSPDSSPLGLLVAGSDGAIFRSRDAGMTWQPLVRNCWAEADLSWFPNVRLPAPMSLLVLVGLVALGWWRWRLLPAGVEEREGLAEELTSDRALEPGEIDRLGFAPFIRGLSAYLRNTATQPPLTLAVTGAWGAGKSSFMNLLRADLEEHGLRTLWFNAWHHQQEPQILAPLLATIQAEAAPSLLSRQFDLALRFHWRLLKQRLLSQRGTLFVAVLLLCFALGVGAALGWKMPTEVLSDWWKGIEEGDAGKSLGGLVGGGSLIGTLAGIALFVWRALKTFGVNPADLLATEAGETSGQALSAQNEFRRKFAEDFGEVTEALKPFPLVIFIDDLDRCEVAKVFQILEAINYLVSSGDCFVVLGMSEERVRDCVALGFKDLPDDFGEMAAAKETAPTTNPDAAEEEADEQDEPAAEDNLPKTAAFPATAPAPQAKPGWSRQRELAQNYLEKLVQLRIDVPRPNIDRARGLVRAEAAAAEAVTSGRFWRAWWVNYRVPLIAVVLLVFVFGVSYRVGQRVGATLIPVTPAAEAKAENEQKKSTAPSAASGGSATGAQANDPTTESTGSTAPLLPRYPERGQAAAAVEGGRNGGGSIMYGILTVILFIVVWIAHRLWQRRLTVVIKDTQEFNDACVAWSDALFQLQPNTITPRALKRFKNRVRFYAMLRATDTKEGGLLPSGLSDASLVALGAVEQAGFVSAGQVGREDTNLDWLQNAPLSEDRKHEVEVAFQAAGGDHRAARTFRNLRKVVKRA